MSTRKAPIGGIGAMILMSALIGCATSEKCGEEGCQSDAKITANVQTAFAQHPELGPPNAINVQTLNHVVYLSGVVGQGLIRETAESVAQQTQGVARVENTIAVSR